MVKAHTLYRRDRLRLSNPHALYLKTDGLRVGKVRSQFRTRFASIIGLDQAHSGGRKWTVRKAAMDLIRSLKFTSEEMEDDPSLQVNCGKLDFGS